MMNEKNEYVVISVFENIVADATNASIGIHQVPVANSESDEYTVDNAVVQEDVRKAIVEVGAIIKAAGIRLPDTKFTVSSPLQRPSSMWYTD